MNQALVHVYFMPGMAASPTIFEHIKLPENTFTMHFLEWTLPKSIDESLSDYAKRMAKKIVHENSVLVGVSFGGILVQEMAKYLKIRKVIIISSVRSNKELPRRMKVARRTKLYKVLPTQLASNIDLLTKYAFGKTITKRLELYRKYLQVNDKLYLDWAIKKVMYWDRAEIDEAVIHIHGDADPVFPIKHIPNCIVIKGGTHIMIINRFKWFNEHLPKLILS